MGGDDPFDLRRARLRSLSRREVDHGKVPAPGRAEPSVCQRIWCRCTVYEGKIGAELPHGDYRLRARFTGPAGDSSQDMLPFRIIPPERSYGGPLGLREDTNHLAKFFRAASHIEIYGNNFRHKDYPIFLNLNPIPEYRGFYPEFYGQLRKIVELGGCAVLFRAEVSLLYRWLLPMHIRPQPVMRTCAYARAHPVFDGLPSGGAVGAEYAEVYTETLDSSEDILAGGGEILLGAFSMNMWTRPAVYYWGASLYRVPVGRGNVIICHLDLPGHAETSPVATRLLNNLARYASSLIQPGGEEYLVTRCIDPLPAGASDTSGQNGHRVKLIPPQLESPGW